jgi:uncharacterized protein YukE
MSRLMNGEAMTEITFDIPMAEASSAGMAQRAEDVRQTRILLDTRAKSVVDVWQCDAELKFQELHNALLWKLDMQIAALDEIRKGLDAAIAEARLVDQDF